MSASQAEETETTQQTVDLAPVVESDKDTAGGSKAKTNGTGATTTTTKEGKLTKKMLKEAEQELFQLLLKKKQLDRNLIDTETAIYDFETSYFENSGQEGNIVHGFDGYLNAGGGGRGEGGGGGGGSHRRQGMMHFTEGDRIFSQSSATFKKAQEAKIAASFMDSESDDSDDGESMMRASSKGVAARKQQTAATAAAGGSTIKHNSGTKKIRLSIDGGSNGQ
ncbi:Chromatin modification- protein meaf6 [Coemansia aciculifera]|uniref:Chromatin modification- protein meaf6 n=1 Tax=Coemansia aciculifera TaxID=417176 RepID=A0ACC1M8I8_9FUNG|nr:Chromatin modification- protein meaf6 [Coemansia aciculifera]KAJ2906657.1 Chromatin modification- protein meaf6 [Coemansia aciculifera]